MYFLAARSAVTYSLRSIFAGSCLLAFGVSAEDIAVTIFPLSGTNGAYPRGALVQARDGNFYGTAEQGGATTNKQFTGAIGNGCVSKMTPDGTITALASFYGTNGAHPWGGLVEADDGNLYGTTYDGGAYPGTGVGGAPGLGTIFRITTEGSLTTIFSFMATNGANPVTALTKGPDGALYGTTRAGGSTYGDPRSFYYAGFGTLFKITTNGDFTSLYSFTSNSDGFSPFSAMTSVSDGNLYGVVYSPSNSTYGLSQVYKLTPAGVVTTFAQPNPAVGLGTLCSLIEGRDGSLYGGTQTGGDYHAGVYKVSRDGFQTMLVSFTNVGTWWGSLVEGTDGNLYGVRESGAVFRITPGGDCITIASLPSSGPYGENRFGLLQANDGSIYGASAGLNYFGQPNQAGFLFRISVPSAAAPKLRTPSKSGDSIALSWSAIAGRTYQVQSASNLSDTNWANVSDQVTATGAVASTSDPSADTTRFYRVVMLP